MKTTTVLRALPFLVLSLLLVGCTDDMLGSEANTQERPGLAETSEKLRHAHLLYGPPADPFSSSTAGSGQVAELIVGFAPSIQTEQDANRVLGRYTVLSRSKILKRRDTGGPGGGGSGQERVYAAAVEFREEEDEDDDDDEEEHEDEDEDEIDDLDDLLEALALDDDVSYVEPDVPVGIAPQFTLVNTDEEFTPWSLDAIGADDVEGVTLSGVDLYVLDGGLGAFDLNVAETVDFVGGTATPASRSHGYHVAGIAAAPENGQGTVGVAPGLRVYDFRILDERGQTQVSTATEAVNEVIGRKLANPSRPVVLNLSFGADTGVPDYNTLDEAVEAAVAAGIVVVVSAGNEGIDARTVTPARAAGALTVGAYDESGTFAAFSNFGSVVDLLAPGVDIGSLVFDGGGAPALALSSGTSMAAPQVAGAAALYLAQNPSATPAQVRDALVGSAPATVTGVPGGTTNRSVWVGGFAVASAD